MTTQAPKVATITGSSRAVGASIAKRLAANGTTVIVNYAGRAADADVAMGLEDLLSPSHDLLSGRI